MSQSGASISLLHRWEIYLATIFIVFVIFSIFRMDLHELGANMGMITFNRCSSSLRVAIPLAGCPTSLQSMLVYD